MNTLFNINVCRVCLQNDQNCDLNNKGLVEKFEFTTRLQVSKKDNLPKAICSNCSKKLRVAYNFIKTAHESEKNLQKFIEKISSEFKIVSQRKNTDIEESLGEDELLSLLDEENREEITIGIRAVDIDSPKKEIDCTFSKDILLMHDSNEIDSACENSSHLIEINTQENDQKESCNEETEENHETDNSQAYTTLNMLETNEEYDVRTQSTEFAIEEPEENHDYDMIINTQEDSTQCQYVNNEDNLTEESYQKFDDLDINNLCEGNENQLQDNKDENNEEKKVLLSSKTGNVDSRFYCGKCSRDFSTKTNLNRHMQSHEGNKPFSCTKCTKSFTQKSTLKQHMYTHTGERPYVCDVCNRGFTQHKSLMFHMRRHTGEKPFHCEYCLITFRQKDALRIHILKHHVVIERDMNGFETFSCIICQKKFERKVEFKMHMKVHTANAAEPSRTKKFQCRKCFKCFALKKSLIRHMCIHNDNHNNDDYLKECFDCDMEFSSAEDYQEHLSMCHQFTCSLCPQFIFNSVQELKIHILEHEIEQE